MRQPHEKRARQRSGSGRERRGGAPRRARLGAHWKVKQLSEWLETLLHLYGSRVLLIDLETARCIGSLADRARGQGQAPGLADLAIAAAAQKHGYTILTRNVRHFGPLGVPALDPFEMLPNEVP